MYTGDNPVAIQSQEWLVNALFELMKTRPYSAVTVRDLCKQADLSRQTFYNCFDGKDDVVRYVLRGWYDQMKSDVVMKSGLVPSALTPLDVTRSFAAVFEQYHSPMQELLRHGLHNIISEEIAQFMRDFQPLVTHSFGTEHTDRYGVAFLNGAITSLLLCWFQDPDPLTTDELAELLTEILQGNYYEL